MWGFFRFLCSENRIKEVDRGFDLIEIELYYWLRI